MTAIKAIGLTRRFEELVAVDSLNLQIERGEIFGLVGPDGAGKTTIMRLLTGVLEPTSGDAWVDDKHIISQTEQIKETPKPHYHVIELNTLAKFSREELHEG